MMGLEQDLPVIEIARDPEQIGRYFVGSVKQTPPLIEHPQIGNRRRKLSRAWEMTCYVRGSRGGFAGFGSGPPVDAHQGRGELRQDGQLGAPPFNRGGLRLNQG